ncbi:MAG: hypothetical protein KC636_39515 [Myxococcales bacterium]|nr:hypothetical protein [Myxococcales bacterium]
MPLGSVAFSLLAPACADPPSTEVTPTLASLAEARGISVAPATTQVAELRLAGPGACPWVYRIRVDEDVPQRIVEIAHREAERSIAALAMVGEDEQSRPLADGTVHVGAFAYRGPRTGRVTRTGEIYTSAATIGPASPNAACFDRSWDPVEDALALGWPRLPSRLTAVGESFVGAPVEGRCGRLACLDPTDEQSGVAYERPCVVPSWQERLVGIAELGPSRERVAELNGTWSDGHPPERGVWSERAAVISVDRGRLLHAEVTIHHNALGITRTIEIDAVDDCPGGLVALGWQPPETPEVAQTLAALRGEEAADSARRRGGDHGQDRH